MIHFLLRIIYNKILITLENALFIFYKVQNQNL